MASRRKRPTRKQGEVSLAELGAIVECLAAIEAREPGAGAQERLGALLEESLSPLRSDDIKKYFTQVPGRAERPLWCRTPISGGAPFEFEMGSPGTPNAEEGRFDNEDQVRVALTEAFWAMATTVTYGQWRLMAPNPAHVKRWGEDDRLPVTCVSWFEACLYARWLGHWRQQEGSAWSEPLAGIPATHRFGLPTEAQWEFMARAGTTTRFWSGDADEDMKRVGWYIENSGQRLHSVAEFAPNRWGLFDVHGNVLEWCRDWYGKELPGGMDPLGPESGSDRVLRGGSCWSLARRCRSADRSWSVPVIAGVDYGFRLVLSAPE